MELVFFARNRLLPDINVTNQVIRARTHTHNVMTLVQIFKAYGPAHLSKARHRTALHIKDIDLRLFDTANMEHAVFNRQRYRANALSHGEHRLARRRRRIGF